MSTQALVTLTRGGKVTRKIVMGCNGGNAEALANAILKRKVEAPQQLLELAKECECACDGCIIVQSGPIELLPEGTDASTLYAQTFEQPTFNPRWSAGTAAFTFIVDLDARKVRRHRYA